MWDEETGDLAVPEGARRPQSGREGGARSWGMGGTEGAYFSKAGRKENSPDPQEKICEASRRFLGEWLPLPTP